jgi:hypothetical protein
MRTLLSSTIRYLFANARLGYLYIASSYWEWASEVGMAIVMIEESR